MDLMGYADTFSLAPGERIRFMVSARVASYKATIVRLPQADQRPENPGFTGEVVDTPITGRYVGRAQALYSGSYVRVPDHSLLRRPASLTLQAWIFPTLPKRPEAQGVLTKWSATTGSGYGLFIEPDGDLAFWIGDGAGRIAKLRTGIALRPREWYFVACTYDGSAGNAALYQELVARWPLDDAQVVVESAMKLRLPREHRAPFLMAAGHQIESAAAQEAAAGHYNGKIDSPRIFSHALPAAAIDALKRGASPLEIGAQDLVAAWDFSQDVSSARIIDTSPHELHGEAINMPARAMTGYNWTGREVDFSKAPAEYGAIHFHEDDLEDARWEADFELTVPDAMRSGLYAARLEAGDVREYIPFYVRPKQGTATAPIAFLAPTMTYLAYANERTHSFTDFTGKMQRSIELEPADRFLLEHPEVGLSVYDRHPDGSGICYSSLRRPVLHMRPNMRAWVSNGLRHFAADLLLLDWLEQKGFPYDVITDHDLHAEGRDLLARYSVVVTGSHPEYWSAPMLDGLQEYLDTGGRLMYLGGNGFYWAVGVSPRYPHVLELRRGINGTRTWESAPGECYLSTTGELSGLWRYRGKAPQKVCGVGFTAQGWSGASGYRRQPGSFDERAAFIFEGIGADEIIGDFGMLMGGAAGDELDRADVVLGTPPHALVLASSFGHDDAYQFVVEDLLFSSAGQGGTENPNVRADMVFFEKPNGGAVFSVGSICWCGSLQHNDFDNNVSRITENVLRRFMSRPPA
ncbi:MAG: subunit beta of N,N-dimethylformamidase [Chloroflexi bacterium]|nr:subunit beta of N,N-dimethylformamidase [Chloroflexota bacterium]